MLSKEDKIIIEKLNSKPPEFWDFKKSIKNHVHNIAVYPAIMVPDMQKEIINIIMEQVKIASMLDPFMGSGTTLVLGTEKNIKNIYGIDINPYAYLLTKVKTTKYNIELLRKAIKNLLTRIEKCDAFPIHTFDNIEKWFKDEIIKELSKIKYCISKTRKQDYRDLFNIIFAEVVRLTWNSRSTTYKLHIKPKKEIELFKINVEKIFKEKLLVSADLIQDYNKVLKSNNNISNIKLFLGDVNTKLEEINDESIDLIITSPPYGDNHTTVPYGQNSILKLRWIGLNNMSIDVSSDIDKTLSKVDKMSLGGKFYNLDYIKKTDIFRKSPTLHKIYFDILNSEEGESRKKEKANKVASFFIDFEKSLTLLYRKLRPGGYAIFTTGNRIVNGMKIPFDKILIELSENNSIQLIYDFKRNILNKRSPSKININKKKKIKSFQKETITIFKKPLD